jgi:hypothetical protein
VIIKLTGSEVVNIEIIKQIFTLAGVLNFNENAYSFLLVVVNKEIASNKKVKISLLFCFQEAMYKTEPSIFYSFGPRFTHYQR